MGVLLIRSQRHPHPHIVQPQTGPRGLGTRNQALALSRQAAAAQQHLAPQLASLPEPVVGSRIAEAQEDRNRQPDQGERNGRQRDLQRKQIPMGYRHQDGNQRGGYQGWQNPRQDGAAQEQEHPETGWSVADDHFSILTNMQVF